MPWLRRFYFGAEADGGGPRGGTRGAPAGLAAPPGTVPKARPAATDRSDKRGLKSLVTDIGEIDAKDVNSFPLAGTDMVVRGRAIRALPGARRARGPTFPRTWPPTS